jgi:hypothetical protein
MINLLLPALGLAGVISNINQQEAARRDINKAQTTGQKLTQRQIDLYDRLMKEAETGVAQLDVNRQLQNRQAMIDRQAQTALGNLAVALRKQGFRPGDQPATDSYARATNQYLQTLADQEEAIRRQNVMDRMGVLGMVNPGILNPALSQASTQEQIARQQFQASNPFAGVLNMLPYFPGMGGKNPAGGTQ